MRYRLLYSPDARDKLYEIKEQIYLRDGELAAKKITSEIMKEIRGLCEYPKKGPSVEALLGIPSPYRFLHIGQYFAFYRLEEDKVYVTDIYNERENYMWTMFHVSSRTQDSRDYWGE